MTHPRALGALPPPAQPPRLGLFPPLSPRPPAPRGAGGAPAQPGALLADTVDKDWSPAPRGWYASLLAGTLPLFALGMPASALADRLDFAGWAIVAGTGYALLLRAAWVRGWSAAARAALVLGWTALALLAFATLVARHQEVLDLGYRALLWPVYMPLLTRPLTARVAAGALVLSALAALVFARTTRRVGGAS